MSEIDPKITVWHGSRPDGTYSGSPSAGLGKWFGTSSEEYASNYGTVEQYSISLQNPYEMPLSEFLEYDRGPKASIQTSLAKQKELQSLGHDSIVVTHLDGVKEYMLFDPPNQIASVSAHVTLDTPQIDIAALNRGADGMTASERIAKRAREEKEALEASERETEALAKKIDRETKKSLNQKQTKVERGRVEAAQEKHERAVRSKARAQKAKEPEVTLPESPSEPMGNPTKGPSKPPRTKKRPRSQSAKNPRKPATKQVAEEAEEVAQSLAEAVQSMEGPSKKVGAVSALEGALRTGKVQGLRNFRKFGKTLDPAFKWIGMEELDYTTKSIVGVMGAVLAGGTALNVLAHARSHEGRRKVAYNSGGSLMGLGAGLFALARTKNPGTALGVMSLTALTLNTAHDINRLHYTPSFALGKSLIAGVGAGVVYSLTTTKAPLAARSLSTAMARFGFNLDKGISAMGVGLREIAKGNPAIAPLLNLSGLGLVAGAVAIPTMHSIIMRSSARARRKKALAGQEQALLGSKQHNQAGRGGRVQSGALMNPSRQQVELNFGGSLNSAYDERRALKGVQS